jgi:hypothetical protein
MLFFRRKRSKINKNKQFCLKKVGKTRIKSRILSVVVFSTYRRISRQIHKMIEIKFDYSKINRSIFDLAHVLLHVSEKGAFYDLNPV